MVLRRAEAARPDPRESVSATGPQGLREAMKAFSAPRFSALYRAWLSEGDIVVWRAQSSVTADAVSLGRGRLECVVLSRQYLHLSRLVGVA